MLQSVSLMNWYLKQTDQSAEVMHKFQRGAVVKPLQYLTVCILCCIVIFILTLFYIMYTGPRKCTFQFAIIGEI